jgi:hypothetical protein
LAGAKVVTLNVLRDYKSLIIVFITGDDYRKYQNGQLESLKTFVIKSQESMWFGESYKKVMQPIWKWSDKDINKEHDRNKANFENLIKETKDILIEGSEIYELDGQDSISFLNPEWLMMFDLANKKLTLAKGLNDSSSHLYNLNDDDVIIHLLDYVDAYVVDTPPPIPPYPHHLTHSPPIPTEEVGAPPPPIPTEEVGAPPPPIPPYPPPTTHSPPIPSEPEKKRMEEPFENPEAERKFLEYWYGVNYGGGKRRKSKRRKSKRRKSKRRKSKRRKNTRRK